MTARLQTLPVADGWQQRANVRSGSRPAGGHTVPDPRWPQPTLARTRRTRVRRPGALAPRAAPRRPRRCVGHTQGFCLCSCAPGRPCPRLPARRASPGAHAGANPPSVLPEKFSENRSSRFRTDGWLASLTSGTKSSVNAVRAKVLYVRALRGRSLAGLGANHSLNFAEAWPRAARHSVQDAPSLSVAQKAGSEMGEIVPGSVVGFRDFCMQITIPSSIPFLDVKLGACASRAAPLRRLAAGGCLLVRRVTISYPRLLFCDQARWWRWSRNWATPRPCGRSWGIRARRRARGPRQPSRACATRHCEATGQGVADVTDRGNSYACAQVPRTGVHGR